MLSRMFLHTKEGQDDDVQRIVPSVQDEQGAYMIDRSPKYFEPILNYLRTGKIIIDTNVSRDGGIYFKKTTYTQSTQSKSFFEKISFI